MKTIYIPEGHLRVMFNSLTLRDDVKAILNTVITRFDHDYTKFMYGIFSAYSRVFVSLMDEQCELSRQEIHRAMAQLTFLRKEIIPGNIFVADKFDLLYGVACTGDLRSARFKEFMYEDMYSRLENIIGRHRAPECMEDIFEAIEHIAGLIEGSLIAVSQSLGEDDANIVFYLDIVNSGLLFVLI